MNPHVYSRRKRVAVDPEPPVATPSGSLLKDIVHAKLSSAVAFAFVLFAAGSVASMTAVAYNDIVMLEGEGNVQLVLINPRPMVLGESIVATDVVTVDDSALESVEPVIKIDAKPISYNSNGRWNYKINYGTKNFTGSGQIKIGTYVVTSSVTEKGSVETGAILKPGTIYRVSFWGDGVKLQSIELKTPKAKSKPQECNKETVCPQINKGEGEDKKMLPPCSQNADKPCAPKPCKEGEECLKISTGTPYKLELKDGQKPPSTTPRFIPR